MADVVSVYINITERKAYLSFIRSKDVVDFVICGFVQFTLSSWKQTNMMTKVDLLKSIIYDNTKATVTLDSTALKQLIQLFAGN